jgi:hypothetical protein
VSGCDDKKREKRKERRKKVFVTGNLFVYLNTKKERERERSN